MSNATALVCGLILMAIAYFGLDWIQKKRNGKNKPTHAEWAAGKIQDLADNVKDKIEGGMN